jgi:hypothetical protein
MTARAPRSILPGSDEAIDALSAEDRERVGREWARRADVELTAAAFSALIVQGLLADGAAPEVIDLAARSVGDEARHARICHEVAKRYLARSVPDPRARPFEEPRYGDCPPPLSRLLALVMHSCINETLATVCLGEGLKRCVSTTARAATRELLQDDLNHARIGWAHLASPYVGAEAKYHIGKALPTLLQLGYDGWMAEPRAAFDEPAHAILGAPRFASLMRIAFDDLVLPGFDHVGVDTGEARAWYATLPPPPQARPSVG